jgi:hypothetical protein
MNHSKRIYANIDNPAEKNIKIKLEQNTNFLEILSLKISQKDAYQFFNADYGVLVGRVIANGGVGIPNAKISIFIPITDVDKENSAIYAIYPYETPRDKNLYNKRYNLLPRVAKENPETGAYQPKQPFGSFPTKEEIVTNDTWLDVYEKYYKYSTITNDAGDYMLFGVPTGVQTVHMSVDITDIGPYSMTPADMIVQLGYSDAFFNSDLTIKPKQDLEDLPHIETQEISVDVIPYWGDSNNFEIGITRQDFRIRAELVNNFTLFGSYFTMGRLSVNGDPDNSREDVGFYRIGDDYTDYNNNVDFRTNRIGNVTIKLYSYDPTITQEVIDNDIATSGNTINPQKDIFLIDPNSYYEFIQDGMFVLSVPCNRRKVITDQLGNQIVVSDDSSIGVFTEFLGMAIIEHEDISIDKTYSESWIKPNSPNVGRTRFKIPQQNHSIREDEDNYPDRKTESELWRKQYSRFEGGKFYSVSQLLMTRMPKNGEINDPDDSGTINTFKEEGGSYQQFLDRIIGSFKVAGEDLVFQSDIDFINIISGGTSGGTSGSTSPSFEYDFPWTFSGKTINGELNSLGYTSKYFGGQWLNLSMYFPQINWTYDYTSPSTARDQNTGDPWLPAYYHGRNGENGEWFTVGGSLYQPLIAGEFNTSFFSKSQSLSTDFIEVPKVDIISLNSFANKGVSKYDLFLESLNLDGNYKYRIPTDGNVANNTVPNRNELNSIYLSAATDITYGITGENPRFFKGMYNTDCIQLLLDLNFI